MKRQRAKSPGNLYWENNEYKLKRSIVHWAFGHLGIWNNAMIYLSDHQTIASQCAIPMPKATFIESAVYGLYRLGLDALYVFAILSFPLHVSVVRASLILAWLLCGYVWVENPYLPY